MNKSNIKVNGIIFISILIILLSVINITALGITPGRTTIDYESGLEREVSFSNMPIRS